jgi:hypothetical protein
MTANGSLGGSDDPLERYRRALLQRQSAESGPVVEPDDLLASVEALLTTPAGRQDVVAPDGEAPVEAAPTAAADGLHDETEPGEGTPGGYEQAPEGIEEQRCGVVDVPAAESQDLPPAGRSRSAERSDDPLARYRQAVDRRKSMSQAPRPASPEPAAGRTAPGKTLDPFRKGRDKQPEALSPSRGAARPRDEGQQSLGAPLDWRIRAGVFTLLLFVVPLVQWQVQVRLGAPLALPDLVAGLSAVLPAALILFGARPGSFLGRAVTVIGSLVVAIIGSAGFAFGLSLLLNELPDGTSLVLGLLLSLGVFTAVWGPLFLILAPVLTRMNLSAQGRT